ncbi:MAG: RNA polymerase sigma factor [Planctomycetota bacterium]
MDADKARFNQLVDDLLPAFVRHAAAMVGDRSAADDVAQKALLSLWAGRRRLPEGRAELRRYALRTLANSAREWHRRESRLRRRQAVVARPHDAAARDELQQSVSREMWALVDELPAAQRDVLVLRFGLGYTLHEAAAELGLPDGTVATRQRAAIAALRERYAVTARASGAVAVLAMLDAALAAGARQLTPDVSIRVSTLKGVIMASLAAKTTNGLTAAAVVVLLLLLVVMIGGGPFASPTSGSPGPPENVTLPGASSEPAVAPPGDTVARNTGATTTTTQSSTPPPADVPEATAADATTGSVPPTPDDGLVRLQVLDADGEPVAARVWFWPLCYRLDDAEYRAAFGCEKVLDVPAAGVRVARELPGQAEACIGRTNNSGAIVAVRRDHFGRDEAGHDVTARAEPAGVGYLDPALGSPTLWNAWHDIDDYEPDATIVHVNATQGDTRVAADLRLMLAWSEDEPARLLVERARNAEPTCRLSATADNPVVVVEGLVTPQVQAVSLDGTLASCWRDLRDGLELELHPATTLDFVLIDDATGGPLRDQTCMLDWTLTIAAPDPESDGENYETDGAFTLVTDSAGRFIPGRIPAGHYRFELDFDMESPFGAPPIIERDLAPGQRTSITIRVARHPSLLVRLTSRGQPVVGWEVLLKLRESADESMEIAAAWAPERDGWSRVYVPRAGTWQLTASSALYGQHDLGSIELVAGAETRLEFDLVPDAPQMQVMVRPVALLAACWMRVVDVDDDRATPRWFRVPQSGLVEVSGLPAGHYRVELRNRGGMAPAMAAFTIDDSGASDRSLAEIMLQPAATLVLTGPSRAEVVVVDSAGCVQAAHKDARLELSVTPGEVTVWYRVASVGRPYDLSRWVQVASGTTAAGVTTTLELPELHPVMPLKYSGDVRVARAEQPEIAVAAFRGALRFLPAGMWRIDWTTPDGERKSNTIRAATEGD